MTTGRVDLEVLGVRLRIEIESEAVARQTAAAWSRCAAVLTAKPQVTLKVGAADLGSHGNSETMESLTRAITVSAMEHRKSELLMLHACVVAPPDGDCLVLVGPSGMGKTTAARTLAQEMGYVSDETAAITDDLRVLPFAKPLSVIERSGQPKAQISPDALSLGRVDPRKPLGVGRVLLLDRSKTNMSQLEIESVDLLPAISLLAEHTSFLRMLPLPLHRLAALVKATDGVLRVRYSDASHLRLLPDKLSQREET